jgi:adhesin/invasin
VPNNIAVSANPTSIRADGTSTSTVTATVTTGVGSNPVVGDTVNFVATGVNPSTTCTNSNLSALTGTTNAAGQVTVTYTASTTVGFCTITATETGSTPAQSNSTTITQHA